MLPIGFREPSDHTSYCHEYDPALVRDGFDRCETPKDDRREKVFFMRLMEAISMFD